MMPDAPSTISKQTLMSSRRALARRQMFVGIFLLVMIIGGIVCSVNLGDASISTRRILTILWAKITSQDALLAQMPQAHSAIVWDIRLPRILLAVIVGGGLAASGAAFQALLLNPLADPYTIGVSTGAAFGAAAAMYANLFVARMKLPIPLCAFGGAMCALFIVLKMATRRGCLSAVNLILAGIIVSSVLSAGISVLKTASGEQVSAIVFWLMGSLAARRWQDVWLCLPIVAVGTSVCAYFGRDLNLMSLGDEDARSLGVPVQTVRRVCVVAASLMTAACVSVSGVIGFVGLIVPHLLRLALTSDNRALLPLSALIGGLLLLMADNVSRLLFALDMPVGVITTLLGGPFFLCIFLKNNR